MRSLKPWSLLFLALLGGSGCGLGIGVEGTAASPRPRAYYIPVSFTITRSSSWGFSEFRVRAYPQKPAFAEIGLGSYWGPLKRLWQTPLPLPTVGLNLGVERLKLDSAHTWITGLYGQAGMEWILLRNFGARTPEVGEGDFLWLYLQTYGKLLYRFPRTLLPTVGVELGFRLQEVPSF